mgnify:CR=1 FL=1
MLFRSLIIPPDHRGRVLLVLRGHGNLDLVRPLHDVIVGQDVAIARDDDPGAKPLLLGVAKSASAAEIVPEEPSKQGVIPHAATARSGDRLGLGVGGEDGIGGLLAVRGRFFADGERDEQAQTEIDMVSQS